MTNDQIEEHKAQFEKNAHRIEIRIKCKNLVDMDVVGLSDPFAILYLKAEQEVKW